MGVVAGQRVAHEIFWAITDDGDRYRHLTPAQALSHLLAVGKPGKIMCENHIDPSLPDSWDVLTINPDGTWLPHPSPIPVED